MSSWVLPTASRTLRKETRSMPFRARVTRLSPGALRSSSRLESRARFVDALLMRSCLSCQKSGLEDWDTGGIRRMTLLASDGAIGAAHP
jgi:hypothetical protein